MPVLAVKAFLWDTWPPKIITASKAAPRMLKIGHSPG